MSPSAIQVTPTFLFLLQFFLRVKAGTAVAHLSHCNSVHLSHGWISQKWCKL